MRRLIGVRTVLVCLALGFVVNVLVAWGLAAWDQASIPLEFTVHRMVYVPGSRAPEYMAYLMRDPSDIVEVDRMAWPISGPAGRPDARYLSDAWWPVGCSYEVWLRGDMSSDEDWVFQRRAGLPLRSMGGYSMQSAKQVSWRWTVDLGINASPAWVQESPTIRLPLRPLALGTIANTASYGGVMLVPVVLLRMMRRRRRRKRGLCVNCAYELAGLPACPECGVHVRPHSGQASSPEAS